MKQISVDLVGHCSELPFEEVLRDIAALPTSKIKQPTEDILKVKLYLENTSSI